MGGSENSTPQKNLSWREAISYWVANNLHARRGEVFNEANQDGYLFRVHERTRPQHSRFRNGIAVANKRLQSDLAKRARFAKRVSRDGKEGALVICYLKEEARGGLLVISH